MTEQTDPALDVRCSAWLGELDLRRADCMDVMREYPDKHFDLAIVDPPYGIGICNQKTGRNNGKNYIATEYSTTKRWDEERPSQEYFDEVRRVSCNQIVWGGNYFADMLQPSRGMIFWDKMIGDNDFSGGEIAWTSYDRPLKIFRHYSGGNRVSNNAEAAKAYTRIHPTQKPVQLYNWLLSKYAKPGQTILDTHMGSGSIAIACYNSGNPLVACEIDQEYYDQAIQRIKRETAQTRLFS